LNGYRERTTPIVDAAERGICEARW
jgi:hypothetical protein